VQREFVAAAPNELCLSDITEHWTGKGKIYLCAVKDVFSNRIVGYSIDAQMTSSLTVTALNNAVLRRAHLSVQVWFVSGEARRRGPFPGHSFREKQPKSTNTHRSASRDSADPSIYTVRKNPWSN